MNTFSSFLIGAASSGSGKTTLTLGLLKALRNRGLSVQPFKCGPDYIDTKYHQLASGNESVNLDLFMSSHSHVEYLYNKYSQNVDVAVTEGVMGLFDGYNRMDGSSAQIAGLLDIPVILVLNAKSMAYSVAPILYGFKNFSDKINLAGVVFNFVTSESHYQYLKDACQDVGIESLGYIPKQASIEIPSRHLGLKLDKELLFEDFADNIADIIEKHIDIDRLLQITSCKLKEYVVEELQPANCGIKIAIARDEAFNFTYRENISYMDKIGKLQLFSPLRDHLLPEADMVYLPGGYPELFLKELSDNKSMLRSIRDYVEKGGRLLAECGGMMYLSSSISDSDGVMYPMVDVLKQHTTMKKMKLKLGYRTFDYNGQRVKGHEFHYSSIDDLDKELSITKIYNAKGTEVDTSLFRYKNALAGYTHIYWGELDLMKFFD